MLDSWRYRQSKVSLETVTPSTKEEFDAKHAKLKLKTEEERQAAIAEDTAEKAKK